MIARKCPCGHDAPLHQLAADGTRTGKCAACPAAATGRQTLAAVLQVARVATAIAAFASAAGMLIVWALIWQFGNRGAALASAMVTSLLTFLLLWIGVWLVWPRTPSPASTTPPHADELGLLARAAADHQQRYAPQRRQHRNPTPKTAFQPLRQRNGRPKV